MALFTGLQRRQRAKRMQTTRWLPRKPATPVGLTAPAVWAGAKLPGDETTFLSAMHTAGLGAPPAVHMGKRSAVVKRTLGKYGRRSDWVPVPKGQLMREVAARAQAREESNSLRNDTALSPDRAGDQHDADNDASVSVDLLFANMMGPPASVEDGGDETRGLPRDSPPSVAHTPSPRPSRDSPAAATAGAAVTVSDLDPASSSAWSVQPDALPPSATPERPAHTSSGRVQRVTREEQEVLERVVRHRRKRDNLAFQMRGLFGFDGGEESSGSDEGSGRFGDGAPNLPRDGTGLSRDAAAIRRVREAQRQQLARYEALQQHRRMIADHNSRLADQQIAIVASSARPAARTPANKRRNQRRRTGSRSKSRPRTQSTATDKSGTGTTTHESRPCS